MAVGERRPERGSRAMASIAPTFQGFPVSSIRMSAMLFEREQGDSYDAKRQADELGASRLFLVDERSDQHGEDRRNDREEHRAFTELQADTQAEDPGKLTGDEAEQRECSEAVSPAHRELFSQDVRRLLKDEKHQEQGEPCRQYHVSILSPPLSYPILSYPILCMYWGAGTLFDYSTERKAMAAMPRARPMS